MKKRVIGMAVVGLAGLVGSSALAAAPSAYTRPGQTQRASVAAGGTQASYPAADLWSADGKSDLSSDGRYVAFESEATNLVPHVVAKAGIAQIYRKDLRTGRVDLVSAAQDGTPGALSSYEPAISGNGRYVAWMSEAPNLVPGDTNATADVFWRDMVKGTVLRVSVTSAGQQAMGQPMHRFTSRKPSISADGMRVSFQSTATNLAARIPDQDPGWCCNGWNVYVRDLRGRTTELVSVGYDGVPAFGQSASISGNGRFVVFEGSTGLVRGINHSKMDVFVRDLAKHTTVLASVATDGARAQLVGRQCGGAEQAPPPPTLPVIGTPIDTDVSTCANSLTETVGALRMISDDGRFVTFSSDATNLVPNVSQCADLIGGAEQYFEYCGATYVRDMVAGRTERVDVNSYGAGLPRQHGGWGQPISGNGRYVAYEYVEAATDRCASAGFGVGPVDDAVAQQLSLLCQPGRAYLYDRLSGEMVWLTRPYNGDTLKPGKCSSDSLTTASGIDLGSLSGDGRYFSFLSPATNLVPGDTNNNCDVFVRDRGPALGVGGMAGTQPPSSLPPGCGLPVCPPLPAGAGLQQARVIPRQSLRDLFIRWDVSRMAPVSGAPVGGLLYELRFTNAGEHYAVRAQRIAGPDFDTAGGASFGLFRQTTAGLWTKVASLTGGYGTIGDSVVAAVPLSLLGGKAQLTDVTAYTAVGSYLSGPTKVLDSLRLSR